MNNQGRARRVTLTEPFIAGDDPAPVARKRRARGNPFVQLLASLANYLTKLSQRWGA
jgi:hypothetical protein